LHWIFSVWTGKEAVVKALGIGLHLSDLPLIDVAASSDTEFWRPVTLGGHLEKHGKWALHSLPKSTGYHISIAAPVEAAVTEIDASEVLADGGI
jgi:phosphopantetheinyl transferase